MDTLGSYLKQERERVGRSLEDVSAATKIRVSILRQLERDRHEGLPTGVFVRGFVRSYLQALGVSTDRGMELLEARLDLQAESRSYSHSRAQESESVSDRFRLSHLLLIVAALLVVMGAYFLASKQREERRTVSSVHSTDVNSGTTRSFSPLKQ